MYDQPDVPLPTPTDTDRADVIRAIYHPEFKDLGMTFIRDPAQRYVCVFRAPEGYVNGYGPTPADACRVALAALAEATRASPARAPAPPS